MRNHDRHWASGLTHCPAAMPIMIFAILYEGRDLSDQGE